MLHSLKKTALTEKLSEDQLRLIADNCSRVFLSAGEQLCGALEVLDKLYIVEKGCLKGLVETKDGQLRIAGFINSGEVAGQYSFLYREPGLAQIVAEFDTHLLSLDRDAYEKIIGEIPELKDSITRALHLRLKHAVEGRKLRRFARVVAFVGAQPETTEILAAIAERLRKRGEKVVVLQEKGREGGAGEHPFVTCATHEELKTEVARLETQFDRCLLLTEPATSPSFVELLTGCEEILWFFNSEHRGQNSKQMEGLSGSSPMSVNRLKRICLLPSEESVAPLNSFDRHLPKWDFIMPRDSAGSSGRMHGQGIDRITRHLCDVKIGLSLAGGGARGLAHLGVLRALDQAGISFDLISGTSAGAMFGLSYATGLQPDYCIEAYKESLTPGHAYRRFLRNPDRLFLLLKYRTHSWDKMLRPFFHDWTFEQLPIPFYSVAVDLVRGRQVVSQSGDIVDAMLESLNLPGIANPILKDGMALVDGGVLNNLPANILKQENADFVVGVKVGSGISEKFGANVPQMKTSEMKKVGTLETMFRVWEVMGTGTAEMQISAIDLLVEPDTSAFSFTDFTKGAELADMGQAAMEPLIPRLHEEIAAMMSFSGTTKMY